jgi:hypothetical protein
MKMGIINTLELINPDIFGKISNDFSLKIGDSSIDWIKHLYKDRNKKLDSYFDEEYEEVLAMNDKNSISAFFKNNFDNLISENYWDLDKSLNRGLDKVISTIPEVKELEMLIEFADSDVKIPNCFTYFEMGIICIWSYKALEKCLKPIKEFKSKDDILAYKSLIVKAGNGDIGKILEACEIWLDDYYLNNWLAIREAILETSHMQWLLGLGIG